MYQKIFSEGTRPAQKLEMYTLRLLYKIRLVKNYGKNGLLISERCRLNMQ
jgi:hypothetical protein